ncbi:MAG TPA: YggS family pyridoxal phosphate-dependent enzyme [Humibacillus xanthopallidus]|nr:YggS family pyridoxal phosphate-dependent enzyme [Humibacillus xanthopallidus]
MSEHQTRRDQLAAGLREVRARIAAACADAGRDPAEVTLIVVTKYFPASDVLLLHDLGVCDFGENRDQEARGKFAEVRAALGEGSGGVVLHFIGQLQTNKASHVAAYADVVHSVDRLRLVSALDRGAHLANRRLDVLLQVDLDTRPDDGATGAARGGLRPEEVLGLADTVAVRDLLRLRGVMAVAPLGADPDAAFARLREVADGIRQRHPGADWMSAGMSGDLEAAVRHGATHLRVGTAILGSRPSLL